MSDILVSICCITYNHEKFIRDAIEGFLNQEARFPFEIIIHDDASTDNTPEIIKEYEIKYPNLIKPIYQDENQYSRGIGGITARFTFPKAQGKYIALCEGDDYWTDPLKLQKQVDFMEKHDECSLCFHAAEYKFQYKPKKNYIYRPNGVENKRLFDTKNIILGGGGLITTASMFFRAKYVKPLPKWYYEAPVGDFPLALILSMYGSVGYLDDVMCVYRMLTSESWSNNLTVKKRKDHVDKTWKTLDSFNDWTNNKYTFWIWFKKISYSFRQRRIILVKHIKNFIKN